MTTVPYRIIGRILGKPEAEALEKSNFERFEETKRQYTQLTEEFDTRAGYYDNCKDILKALGGAENRIYEIESMKSGNSMLTVARGEARRQMEEYILSSPIFAVKIDKLQKRLDYVEELLSDLRYEDAKPVLPVFSQVREICDIDEIVRRQTEIQGVMEEERERIVKEAVKNAGISEDAVNFLTTNEIMMKLILVSQPQHI